MADPPDSGGATLQDEANAQGYRQKPTKNPTTIASSFSWQNVFMLGD
jgi:hypothetical protein